MIMVYENKIMLCRNKFTFREIQYIEEQTYAYRGKGESRDRSGVWDRYVHTTIFKISNQQGPTVEQGYSSKYFIIT